MYGSEAARIARDAAREKNGDYYDLTKMNCWQGVLHCQARAGASSGPVGSYSYEGVISLKDQAVANANGTKAIPEGAFIGFFDGARLMHAMIATGNGTAAGNVNSCVGFGHDVGWEVLDLAGLKWSDGRVAVGDRQIDVRHRACP